MRALLSFALLVGCGNKPSPDAVNALVDQARNPKLHFIEREVTTNKAGDFARVFTVIVPDDWAWNGGEREFYGNPDDHGTNHIAFTSSCYGEPCSAGDFKGEIDKDLAESIKVIGAKVLENRSTPTERRIVTKDVAGRIAIQRFWWVGDVPSEYFGCWIVTSEEFEPSRAAFEKACELAVVQK